MHRSDWLWLGGIGLVALVFWWSRDVDGSGTPASERRALPDFHEIEIEGAVRVEVRVGPEPSVELSGDDNLLSRIETKVSGDVLTVRGARIDPKLPLVVTITTPELARIEISGSGTGSVTGVASDELAIELNGSGKLAARGRAERLIIDIAGSGEVDARELACERATVDVAGSGDIELAEPTEIVADIAGSGTVRHGGNPRIDQDISGSGRIVRR